MANIHMGGLRHEARFWLSDQRWAPITTSAIPWGGWAARMIGGSSPGSVLFFDPVAGGGIAPPNTVHTTVYNRYHRRSKKASAVSFAALTASLAGTPKFPSITPTSKPVAAPGGEGGPVQAIGRTKAGRNTKVRAISDQYCRPSIRHPAKPPTSRSRDARQSPSSSQISARRYDTDHRRAWLIRTKFSRSSPIRPIASNHMPSTASAIADVMACAHISPPERLQTDCQTLQKGRKRPGRYASQQSSANGFECVRSLKDSLKIF